MLLSRHLEKVIFFVYKSINVCPQTHSRSVKKVGRVCASVRNHFDYQINKLCRKNRFLHCFSNPIVQITIAIHALWSIFVYNWQHNLRTIGLLVLSMAQGNEWSELI
jgi:hypothetical protein